MIKKNYLNLNRNARKKKYEISSHRAINILCSHVLTSLFIQNLPFETKCEVMCTHIVKIKTHMKTK